MASTSNTVTIDRTYFEALLRRAEFSTANDLDAVTITRAEHEAMIRSVSEYRSLCKSLIQGGLREDLLQMLTNGANGDDGRTGQDAEWDCTFNKPKHVPVRITAPEIEAEPGHSREPSKLEGHLSGGAAQSAQNRSNYPTDETYRDSDPRARDDRDEIGTNQAIPREAKRTVHITNLASQMTLKDLIDVIRGGRILEVYFRNDHSVIASFAEGAEDFINYVRRNNICLGGRRIEVKWAERQFQVAPHVAHKLTNGASRNLVIRRGAIKLTEEGIREDMEHISNLVILDTSIRGNDIYMSTNSVHQAMFARTCMMSRAPYKGLRIEWFPDPCAAPIPKPRNPSRNSQQSTDVAVNTKASLVNRYTLLSLDDGNSDSEKENDEHQDFSGYGVGLASNWAESVAA